MIARANSAFRDDGRHHGFLLVFERCEYAIGTVFDVIMNGASFAGPPLVGLRRTRSAHLDRSRARRRSPGRRPLVAFIGHPQPLIAQTEPLRPPRFVRRKQHSEEALSDAADLGPDLAAGVSYGRHTRWRDEGWPYPRCKGAVRAARRRHLRYWRHLQPFGRTASQGTGGRPHRALPMASCLLQLALRAKR